MGIRSHGYRDWGHAVVNILVPDNALLAERVSGQDSPDRISHTPEQVDGLRESDYFEVATMLKANHHVPLSVLADLDELPIKVRVDGEDLDGVVDLKKFGEPQRVGASARLKPVVFERLARFPVVGKWFAHV